MGRSGHRVPGQGDSKVSDPSVTEGMHLKYSKRMKHVGAAGGWSHRGGPGRRESGCVSGPKAAQEGEGSPKPASAVWLGPRHMASRVGFLICQMGS